MTYEHDVRSRGRFAGAMQAERLPAGALEVSKHAPPVPGRRTLTEAMHPAPVGGTGRRPLHGPETEGLAAAAAAPLPALQLGRKAASPKAAASEAEDAKKGEAVALGGWAGAGRSGRIFQNDTIETFVDGATGDSVEVRTDWMLAEFESFELKTTALLAVERAILVRLARGVTVLARSRARAWLHADRLPNDVHAALDAPARLVKHDGSIIVTDDKGAHLLAALPPPLAPEQSVTGSSGTRRCSGSRRRGRSGSGRRSSWPPSPCRSTQRTGSRSRRSNVMRWR